MIVFLLSRIALYKYVMLCYVKYLHVNTQFHFRESVWKFSMNKEIFLELVCF